MRVHAKILHEYLSVGAHDVHAGERWIYDTYLDNIQGLEMSEEEEVNHPLELGMEEFCQLQQIEIKQICIGQGMSSEHIGGDDIISYVEEVLQAVKDGLQVITWYGSETEVLIIAVKPDTIELINEE